MERSWTVDQRKLWGWGDPDRQFDLSHRPGFWPFFHEVFGISKPVAVDVAPEAAIVVPPSRIPAEFLQQLRLILKEGQIATDPATRLRHSFGQGYTDLLRLRKGQVDRSPDLVAYPEDHRQVMALLKLAAGMNVCVVPFGGGTNIFRMLEVDGTEKRPVVSLDTCRMNRLLEIDIWSRTARFQCGVFGPDLEACLEPYHLVLRHLPDSFRLSTLGGWLATRSAGMLSSGYGRIEDMVMSVKVATPEGELETRPVPASSAGPDMGRCFLGSEGTLGIITEATMKLHPTSAVRKFQTWLFQDMQTGVEALRRLAERGCMPDLVRLMDESQMSLMRALAPERSSSEALCQKLGRFALKWFRGMSLEGKAIAFTGFEGNRDTVTNKIAAVKKVLGSSGGVPVGEKPAENWFAEVLDFGYFRDLMYAYGILGDAAETSATWARLLPIYHAVVREVRECYEEWGLKGFISGHVSHLYPNGASLYFVFACPEIPQRELEQHRELRRRITEKILALGGALSHHHAVGRDLKPWFKQECGQTGVQSLQSLKKSLDPGSILNPGTLFEPESGPESDRTDER